MTDPLDLSGRVVLVTGGGRGVGRGITERFLEAGAEVVICGRNAPEKLPEAAGRAACFHAADVREIEQIDALITFVTDRFGRLDELVNNAGGSPPAEAATASPRFSEAILRLNLIAPLHLSQRANAVMQEQEGGGSIVNVGSVSALRPSPGTAAYGAAKAGLLSLTQSLAVEWAPKVRVNVVTAGLIRTEQELLEASRGFVEKMRAHAGRLRMRVRLARKQWRRRSGAGGRIAAALEVMRRPVEPTRIFVTDLERAYLFDLDRGLRRADVPKPDCDIWIRSDSLHYAFAFLWGGGTLQINGRFHEVRPGSRLNLFEDFWMAKGLNAGDALTWSGLMRSAWQRLLGKAPEERRAELS